MQHPACHLRGDCGGSRPLMFDKRGWR